MDNHPIPQDVTHFQFKLIGELTIKQFAYVGAGGILAWICFSLPINFLIKLLFALLFGGTGAIFAFVPIEGRPADVMLTYFFKALLKPNQFVFHKENSISPTDMHYALLTTPAIQQTTNNPIPIIQPVQKATPRLAMNQSQFIQPQTTPVINQQSYIPQAQNVVKPIMPPPQQPQQSSSLQPQIVKIQQVPSQVNPDNEKLQSILAQKEQLEKQLAQLHQQLAQKPQPTVTPSPSINPGSSTPPTPVKKPVQPSPGPKMPMVSDFPNIILGVIKDSRGNVLPNILVEVKDTEDNPVRAFKTNALGQFASATPLLNGTYMMVFEDPAKKHKFDVVQITAAGEIMQPIEVISIDDREELRKELFG